jgi:ankyrin repeat protein
MLLHNCMMMFILICLKGAEVNARDIYNSTPLMAAAKTGAFDTVMLLMSKGADPTIKNVDSRTAVFNAVGHSSTMEILLQVRKIVNSYHV